MGKDILENLKKCDLNDQEDARIEYDRVLRQIAENHGRILTMKFCLTRLLFFLLPEKMLKHFPDSLLNYKTQAKHNPPNSGLCYNSIEYY